MFQISSVNSFDYHAATLLGLMPAQAINAYLGSKLRSIHDVINDNHTALAGYGMFIFEVSAVLSCFMTLLNHFILMTPRLIRLPFIISKVYMSAILYIFHTRFNIGLSNFLSVIQSGHSWCQFDDLGRAKGEIRIGSSPFRQHWRGWKIADWSWRLRTFF